MSASTQGILFFGAVNPENAYSRWSAVLEEKEQDARKQGLLLGTLADGDTTGFYLAMKTSVVIVDAGRARPLSPERLAVQSEWVQKIRDYAKSIGLPLSKKLGWYLACETDRDY